MRLIKALAAIALGMAVGSLAPHPASAFDRDLGNVPTGWHSEQTVRHWVYYPRYRHVYYTTGATDPYAYRYEPRGTYPYYNSRYWKPRAEVAKKRPHFVHPKYYPAWGANKKHWNSAEWHAAYHHRRDRADQ